MRQSQVQQEEIWIANGELAWSPGHPFYRRLNGLLDEERFDEPGEKLSRKFYAPTMGSPSQVPRVYFRSLTIGYFEGIASERGITWRMADSLAMREFVHIGITGSTPDHSTISRTRRLIDVEAHREVFGWVLARLAGRGLVKGHQVRGYIPKREQKGRRKWEGKASQQQAVYANRRRVQGNYGNSLPRRRGEFVERSFAHCYDAGEMRRPHLRKHDNLVKGQLVHVAGLNLSLIFRKLLSAGAPWEWNNRGQALFLFFLALFIGRQRRWRDGRSTITPPRAMRAAALSLPVLLKTMPENRYLHHGLLTHAEANLRRSDSIELQLAIL